MIKELVTKNLNLFIYMKLLRNTLKNTSLNIFSKGKINLKLFKKKRLAKETFFILCIRI